MFQHVKDLQFDAKVSGPDPRFANMLLDQFGGGNGELKAAMQYFVQAFGCRRAYPDKYDLLMDVATEEFSHLEIVGATITMLLDGVNGQVKDAAEGNLVAQMGNGSVKKTNVIAMAMDNPRFLLESGGGPMATDSLGVPWTGAFVNSNGDLTVDLRSNIAAETRAKIVYERLLQFTDDPYVQDSLRFLMMREIAHFQQFARPCRRLSPISRPAYCKATCASRTLISTCRPAKTRADHGTREKDHGKQARSGSMLRIPLRRCKRQKARLRRPSKAMSATRKKCSKSNGSSPLNGRKK